MEPGRKAPAPFLLLRAESARANDTEAGEKNGECRRLIEQTVPAFSSRGAPTVDADSEHRGPRRGRRAKKTVGEELVGLGAPVADGTWRVSSNWRRLSETVEAPPKNPSGPALQSSGRDETTPAKTN